VVIMVAEVTVVPVTADIVPVMAEVAWWSWWSCLGRRRARGDRHRGDNGGRGGRHRGARDDRGGRVPDTDSAGSMCMSADVYTPS
jgi:hypothetical protein